MRFCPLRLACVLLALGAGGAQASPPLGCVENSLKQRWCQSSGVRFKRVAPVADNFIAPAQHPAFRKVRDLPEPIGVQVRAIPSDEFLPSYFENRLYPIPEKVVAPVVAAGVPDAKP